MLLNIQACMQDEKMTAAHSIHLTYAKAQTEVRCDTGCLQPEGSGPTIACKLRAFVMQGRVQRDISHGHDSYGC